MNGCRVALVMLLIGAALAACSRPPAAPEPVRAVRVEKVTSVAVRGSHEFAAEVRARTESRLGFRVDGKLVQRSAELGQLVKAGQVLAELDPQDLRLSQQAAQSAVRAAQVNAAQANDDLTRFKELFAQGFISEAELTRRQTAANAATAQLRQLRAQSAMQVNQVGYGKLTAPAEGVVTGIEAEPGAVLAAGAPVLRLAHAGPRDAVFSVPEDAVTGLRALLGRADTLTVRLWGHKQTFPASVREVAAAADPVTRTFLVKADLGDAVVDLGQTATVTLKTAAVDGVTRLPLSALLRREGKTAVWLLDEATMTVRLQPVEVTGADGNQVLIAGDLGAGAEVVTAGVHVLTAGQKVTRYEPAAVPSAAASAPGR